MAERPGRPTSVHSSIKDGESFEDAHEDTPRPIAPHQRSRSRSLLGKRQSSSSASQMSGADSPASALSPVSTKAHDESEKSGEVKTPLTAVSRMSILSDMDHIPLDQDVNTSGRLPDLPPRETAHPSGTLQGLSRRIIPPAFSPPPPPPPAPEKSAPPPPRKLTSPFSWLSRNSNSKKAQSPPPAADRRNTNASVTTIESSTDMSQSNGSQSAQRLSQGSLKDRFKFLRMREEAGITMSNESTSETGRTGRTSLGTSFGSPTSVIDDEASSPALAKQAAINPNLAPGTAAGIAAGPAGDTAEPVDWDLWQTVVNDGPAAIERTSSEELNRAIANGIPQVIRGVIWQVLAQSKDEELESTYRGLVARGTDKEQLVIKTPIPPNGSTKEKESVASSASSIDSDYSIPATTAASTNGPLHSSSATSETSEGPTKQQARLATEKRQSAIAISKLEKAIKRDLGTRTSYSRYIMAAGLQDGLFGICKAYALYDEVIGYAQGMNFVAMPLLFNMPEEEAFSLFVTLMNKYRLRDLFLRDMAGLHLHLFQFERLLEELEPALYCHLRRREVKPQLYATQWFLTLFAYRFPLQLVLRIYDLIFSEGLESAILKFAIVLMQKNAETLLGMKDMSTLTTFLKERIFDVYIDKAPSVNSILESGFFGSTTGVDKEVYRADTLVKDAVAVDITPGMIRQYTLEWKEQQRTEKERESELHGLKEKAALLESKVRLLEIRAEQSDMEHVQVASELIKTKVENEGLADENETLKTKVEGLQKIVDTQTEEVEARLKSDMETVMQKNITVHNENRALEESMADMEKELVATKMQWATINEEHENLKQKWNSISQMMK